MSYWSNFISALSDNDHLLIITQYERLCRDGVIGECLLRSKTREWIGIIDVDDGEMLIMRDIAFESYKHFASKYFAANDLPMESYKQFAHEYIDMENISCKK